MSSLIRRVHDGKLKVYVRYMNAGSKTPPGVAASRDTHKTDTRASRTNLKTNPTSNPPTHAPDHTPTPPERTRRQLATNLKATGNTLSVRWERMTSLATIE